MKVLLIGSSGYVGSAFKREMDRRDMKYDAPLRSMVDYTKFDVLRKLMARSWPDLVINCAALVVRGAVDNNEDFKSETILANTVFPVTLANVCELCDVPLIQVSSGCLYNDDSRRGSWEESDPPHLTMDTGAGIYVSSKGLAERAITYGNVWKCRMRLPFDEFDGHRNYLSKIQRYPKVFDGFNSLSHRGDFVKACLDMFEKGVPFGTYHLTCQGAMWTHDITVLIKKHLGEREFKWWDTEEFLALARTKKSNCTLSVDKLKSVGITMRSVREAVEESLVRWMKE